MIEGTLIAESLRVGVRGLTYSALQASPAGPAYGWFTYGQPASPL
jgi:hypothetical protein